MGDIDRIATKNRSQRVVKAAYVFFAGMIILAVLSNTINNISLPRVRTEWPIRGSIINDITINGNIMAKKNYQFYAPMAIQVQEICVHTGDQVKKGQQILKLDAGGLKKQLQDESDRYEQKKISLELLKLKKVSGLENFEEAINNAKIQMERAMKDHERISELTELGLETREKLEIAARKLDDARMAYEQVIYEREKALLSSQAEAQKIEMEIQSLLYDMEIQKRGIEQLKKQIRGCDVIAPFDGIITAVECNEGEFTGTSQLLFSIMDISEGYCFKGFLDKGQADDIKPGDEAELITVGFEWQKTLGKVVEIINSSEYPGERMEIELAIPHGQWNLGQKCLARLEKRSAVYEFLVSNSAIGKDNEGYFVYIPEEKKGYLGNEIYARLVRVTIGESDFEKTAIVQGLNEEDRIIVSSDKPLADGIRIIWDP